MGAITQFGIASMEHLFPKLDAENQDALRAHYARAKESIAIYNEFHRLKMKHNFAEIAQPIVDALYHKLDQHNLKKLYMLAVDFHFVNGYKFAIDLRYLEE